MVAMESEEPELAKEFGASRFLDINKRLCKLKDDFDVLGLEGPRG